MNKIKTSAGHVTPSQAVPGTSRTLPLLQNGDRLTRTEFERRYTAMPRTKKAELIEGIVYMPSPVSCGGHGTPHFFASFWLGPYVVRTPGITPADNSTVRLDLDNEPQPDLCLFIRQSHGGQSKLVDDFIEGAPEFVMEISNSSVSIDLHAKFNAYRRNGVREYVVWRTADEIVDWFVLRDADYKKIEATSDGVLKSEVFPGLWLNAAALLKSDLIAVVKTVEEGLATQEHTAFVAKLQENASKLR